MARPRKARNDSAAGKMELMVAAKTAVKPVTDLDEAAQVFFDHYVSTRPSFDWTRGDLVRLTKLAERMAEVDRISKALHEEGLVVVNHRGTQIVNPLVSARDSLERTCMAAERSLSVYAPMSGSRKATVYEQGKEVEKMREAGDDLL